MPNDKQRIKAMQDEISEFITTKMTNLESELDHELYLSVDYDYINKEKNYFVVIQTDIF